MGFRIPDRERDSAGQEYQVDVVKRLEKQLRESARVLTGAQILVGGVFPLGEAVLVNVATNAENVISTASITLAVVAVIHIALLVEVVRAENPLPQFLVQFNDQQAILERTREEVADKGREISSKDNMILARERIVNSYLRAATAATTSLIRIQRLERQGTKELEAVFGLVLAP